MKKLLIILSVFLLANIAKSDNNLVTEEAIYPDLTNIPVVYTAEDPYVYVIIDEVIYINPTIYYNVDEQSQRHILHQAVREFNLAKQE